MAAESFFHAGIDLELQTARSARILPGWQAVSRIPGLTLDKKKGFLVGSENQACMIRQHIK